VKAYGGSRGRGIAVLVPNLDARWVWVVVITPWEITAVPIEESKSSLLMRIKVFWYMTPPAGQ